MQGQRRIDWGMHRAGARIRLEADLIAAPRLTERVGQRRKIQVARLIELEEAETPGEDSARSGKALLRQKRGDDAGTGSLTRLESLGERGIEDALPGARRLAERNAEGVVDLISCESEQLAGNGGRAEHADRGGAMPAPVRRGGEARCGTTRQARAPRRARAPRH